MGVCWGALLSPGSSTTPPVHGRASGHGMTLGGTWHTTQPAPHLPRSRWKLCWLAQTRGPHCNYQPNSPGPVPGRGRQVLASRTAVPGRCPPGCPKAVPWLSPGCPQAVPPGCPHCPPGVHRHLHMSTRVSVPRLLHASATVHQGGSPRGFHHTSPSPQPHRYTQRHITLNTQVLKETPPVLEHSECPKTNQRTKA